MAYGFLDIAATASVKEAQRENGSADYWACFHGERSFDRFTENEAAFIAARDSFYMATVSESGWPYVQHRGGPPGFIRMLDDKTLAIADYRGNRQYITVGNVAAGGRASLILMDYANRRRLKIFAHVEIKNLADDPELAARWQRPATRRSRNACSSSTSTPSTGIARNTSRRVSPKPRSTRRWRRCASASRSSKRRTRRCGKSLRRVHPPPRQRGRGTTLRSRVVEGALDSSLCCR